MAIEKMGEQPPVDFAWFNMGSQGRKEQLLKTDQDNALIFADVSDEIYDWVKNYFVEMSRYVNEILEKVYEAAKERDIYVEIFKRPILDVI
jgi:CBS domain-containing protein